MSTSGQDKQNTGGNGLNMTMPVPSGNNVMATMYLQTGKSSLMQRMASPRGGVAIPVSTKGDKIMKNGAGSTMHSN